MRQWTWGRRWTVRAVSFLLAAFAVLGGLAIQGHQKAEAYQRYLANSRRHAFAELSTGLNELDADLQKGIYATSPAMLTMHTDLRESHVRPDGAGRAALRQH